MTPETRSRSAATPARVYHSSPALQQVQFPSRRRKVLQTYGRQTPTSLRQQTLTQIDFVSSFEDNEVASSGDPGRDKENRSLETPDQEAGGSRGTRKTTPGGCYLALEEAELVASGQSRGKRKGPRAASPTVTTRNTRRRTLGQATDATAEAVGVDDGHGKRRGTVGGSPANSRFHTQTLTQFLGHRTLIADSEDDDDVSLTAASDGGPDAGFLDWLDGQASPSGRHSRVLSRPLSSSRRGQGQEAARLQSREESVIPQTPLKRVPAVPSASPSGHGPEALVGRYGPPDVTKSPLEALCSPLAAQPPEPLTRLEATPTSVVPGSPMTPSQLPTAPDQTPGSSRTRQGRPTSRAADGGDETAEAQSWPATRRLADGTCEIPDSEDEADEDGFEQPSARAPNQPVAHALARSTQQAHGQRPEPVRGPGSGSGSPPPRGSTAPGHAPDAMPRPLRQPASPPRSPPLESQRVPMTDLQSLPPHTPRSDILLPVAAASLAPLVAGLRVDLEAACRIPGQVVRLWLLDRALLRYMACVDGPARPAAAGAWRYRVCQMYELNNPVAEHDMRRQGWLHGPLARYAYLPPAVVGQLLWNLRRALFAPRPPLVSPSLRPPPSSQATTASQPSTPDRGPPASSTSLVFLDHGASHATLSLAAAAAAAVASSPSILLSCSQRLPDSLLRDLPPPELWHSDSDSLHARPL